MADFPDSARAIVIGGGIVGCSTAYHLAKLGWRDTLIIERHKLSSGSTHHAAGLVGQLRTSANITQLLGYSVALYESLEAETGLASGWKMNGGLRLACNADRWTELKRQSTSARSFGLDMQLLTPREAQQLWPLMDISDLVGAAFLPTDGQVNPADITQSLAKGARMRGVRIFEDTNVLGVELKGQRVSAVLTSRGRVSCEVIVNCAGQWARHRCDPRHRAGLADAARSGPPHVLQGRCRRPGHGRVRTQSAPLGARRVSGQFQFSAAGAGLGSFSADPRSGNAADAGAFERRGERTH